jgi:hypothetical protein
MPVEVRINAAAPVVHDGAVLPSDEIALHLERLVPGIDAGDDEACVQRPQIAKANCPS